MSLVNMIKSYNINKTSKKDASMSFATFDFGKYPVYTARIINFTRLKYVTVSPNLNNPRINNPSIQKKMFRKRTSDGCLLYLMERRTIFRIR